MTWALDFSDNFNRADGPLGSNYTNIVGSSIAVLGNKVTMPGGSNTAVYNGATYADVAVEITWESQFIYIGWRLPSSGSNQYLSGYELLIGSGAGNIDFFSQNGSGGQTYIAGYSKTLVPGDVIRAEMVGSAYTFYLNGTVFGSGTDTRYSAAGAVGMSGYTGGTADNLNIYKAVTALNLSKTQIATSRIAVTRTKSQSATAHIVNLTGYGYINSTQPSAYKIGANNVEAIYLDGVKLY